MVAPVKRIEPLTAVREADPSIVDAADEPNNEAGEVTDADADALTSV